MIVIEFLDAVDALAKALAVWFVVGAAIATPVVLVAGWAVTRVVKWAWQRIRPRARRGVQAPAGAPQGCSCGSDFADGAPEASEGPLKDFDYREAA